LNQASSVHFDRTPATDDITVNKDTHINISLEKYQEIVGSKDGKNVWWTTDMDVEIPIKLGN